MCIYYILHHSSRYGHSVNSDHNQTILQYKHSSEILHCYVVFTTYKRHTYKINHTDKILLKRSEPCALITNREQFCPGHNIETDMSSEYWPQVILFGAGNDSTLDENVFIRKVIPPWTFSKACDILWELLLNSSMSTPLLWRGTFGTLICAPFLLS